MNTEKEREVSLSQLAEETGVPARTVRFYIARGLLRGPLQAGRGASYGNEHRKQLAEIKRLQAQGLTLVEIAKSLALRQIGNLGSDTICLVELSNRRRCSGIGAGGSQSVANASDSAGCARDGGATRS